MKTLLIIIALFFIIDAQAICLSPLSRTNINGGQIPTSLKYNSDFNDLYDRVNNFPGDCIADGTIRETDLADGSITTAKIQDATIQASKFASGAIPSYQRPLRISAFTTSGEWTRQLDVGAVFVQVVGGGGASGHQTYGAVTAGQASKFGTHCTANGGGASPIGDGGIDYGIGGGASGGDINLKGGDGTDLQVQNEGYDAGQPGISMIGHFGKGGRSFYSGTNFAGGGGGAGGYCAKYIQAANLGSKETVTIGAGGTWSNANSHTRATSGIVLIYEYAL